MDGRTATHSPSAEDARRLVAGYDPAFRSRMTVDPDQLADGAALAAAVEALQPPAFDLVLALVIGLGPGQPVPERLREAVEEDGEALWLAGVLLPRSSPGPGATIDPRYYAAHCRLNSALDAWRPLAALREDGEGPAHPPPADARWDAIVVAARLEAEPVQLTREGLLRKDSERRLFDGLGGDPTRWALALAVGRASGLARTAGGRLYGYPETHPRVLTDPATLLPEGAALAAAALLRLVDERWLPLEALIEFLQAHCPVVFAEDGEEHWRSREADWLRDAADLLHRIGAIDARRDAAGVVAIRRATVQPSRPPGFLLTPDRDIILAPWELPGVEYGRLCRLAGYVDGDVVHRHHLTREGVAADLAAGHTDTIDWLAARSRTGMPGNVREVLDQWGQSAERVTVLSGATVVERNGTFELVSSPPAGARTIAYDKPPPARFHLIGDELRVPFGSDALTVRAAVSHVGEPMPAGGSFHRWRLAPSRVERPDYVLDELRRYHDGPLPGPLEASIHAAAGRSTCWLEDAVVIHLPVEATDALRRDPVSGPMLGRQIRKEQFVVDRADLDRLSQRLRGLGFELLAPGLRPAQPSPSLELSLPGDGETTQGDTRDELEDTLYTG